MAVRECITEYKAERGVVHEGSLGSGQYQQGVVYAVKRGQAEGIPTHAAAHRRRGQHTQLENTNTQDKEDKAHAQCEAPLRCVQCEQHAS